MPVPLFQIIPGAPSGGGGSTGRARRASSRRIGPREGARFRAGRTPRARRDRVRVRERDVSVVPACSLDGERDSAGEGGREEGPSRIDRRAQGEAPSPPEATP